MADLAERHSPAEREMRMVIDHPPHRTRYAYVHGSRFGCKKCRGHEKRSGKMSEMLQLSTGLYTSIIIGTITIYVSSFISSLC